MTKRDDFFSEAMPRLVAAVTLALGLLAGGCSTAPAEGTSLAGQDEPSAALNLDDAIAAAGDTTGSSSDGSTGGPGPDAAGLDDAGPDTAADDADAPGLADDAVVDAAPQDDVPGPDAAEDGSGSADDAGSAEDTDVYEPGDAAGPDGTTPDGGVDVEGPDGFEPDADDPCDDDEECDDGDLCTIDACGDAGVCSHAPLDCPDGGEACFEAACDPASGCALVAVDNGLACDDGEPCSVLDACQAGACVGEPNPCDDGDACTEDGCEAGVGCLWDTVECPAASGPCVESVCKTDVGCTEIAAQDGLPCDDAEDCTIGDACTDGTCVGVEDACDDEDACTQDGCTPGVGCWHQGVDCAVPDDPCLVAACDKAAGCGTAPAEDGTECDDGEACTEGDVCVGGSCQGQSADCDDGDACTVDGCAADGGCQPKEIQCPDPIAPCSVAVCDSEKGCGAGAAPDGQPCDDGDICSVDDACLLGECVGEPADCDDDDACTVDACVAGAGCDHSPVLCDPALGDCLTSVCDPTAGCTSVPDVAGTPCNDGDICTTEDQCAGDSASCEGTDQDCDDGDACTTDTCDPAAGCQHDPVECAAPDDACLVAVCESDAGCVPAPAATGTPCNDAEPCTVSDACDDGICAGVTDPCDDGNACTDDGCTPGFGCVHAPAACPTPEDPCSIAVCDDETGCGAAPGNDGASCEDGEPCTAGDACLDGACVGGPTACDDDDACTEDLCDPTTGVCDYAAVQCPDSEDPCLVASCEQATGCGFAPGGDGGECDDDNACTSNDVCQGGICVGSGNPCDDGDACTVDLCQAGGGCDHEPVDCPDPGLPCKKVACDPVEGCGLEKVKFGTICDDGKLCTVDAFCQGGVCAGGVPDPCDDGNACTADSCSVALGGCQHSTVSCAPPSDPCLVAVCDEAGGCLEVAGNDGATCNDGDVCTVDDACSGGSCVGTPDTCDDGNACTVDACLDGIGCDHETVVCVDPADECIDAVCDETEGCKEVPAEEGLSCDDGQICTLTDRCEGGECVGTPEDCDDGDACTFAECTAGVGCVVASVVCDAPVDPCMQAVCDSDTGCGVEAVPDGTPCESDDGCAAASCQSGACVVEATPGCGIHAQCNNASPGASCDDGDATTVSDACFAGLCAGWEQYQVEAPTEIELTLVDHAGGSWWVGGALEGTGAFLAIADVPSSPGLANGTVQSSAFTDLESGFAVDEAGQVWRLTDGDWGLSAAYNEALEETGTGELLGLWRGQTNGSTQLWVVGQDGDDSEYIRYCEQAFSGAGNTIVCWPQLLNDSNPPSLPRAIAGALECNGGCNTGLLALGGDAESQGGSFWNDLFENDGGQETEWAITYFDDGASAMQTRGIAALTTSRFLAVGLDGYMRHRGNDGGWSFSLDWLKNGAAGTRDFRAVWVGQGAIFVAATHFGGGGDVGLEIWTCPAGASPESSDNWTIHSLGPAGPDGALHDISGTGSELYAVGVDGDGGSQIWVRLP